MSLIATRLQNWRVEDPEFDRNMTRPCEYGARAGHIPVKFGI